jgi:competence protein ComEC
MCGAAFSSAFHPPFHYCLPAFFLGWFLSALLTLLKKRKPAVLLVLVTYFLLGSCIYILRAFAFEIPDQLAQHYGSDRSLEASLVGVVTECHPLSDGERLTFALNTETIEINGTRTCVEGRTRINWYQPSGKLEPGDVVRVAGRLKLLRGFKNPHTFDYERYMYRRGFFTRMFARGPDSVLVLRKGGLSWPLRWRAFFRQKGLDIVARSTRTDETRAFTSAILLGERGLLTKEMQAWFKQTGTFHILAISGLHVGLVYLIASLALTPFSLGTRARVAIGILIVWLYAFATGGGVPVTRASIMLTLVLAAYYIGREGDFLTAVAFAALVLVMVNPTVIDDVSFHLSFTAMVLLCTFEPIFTEKIYPLTQQKLGRIPAPILHKLLLTLFASLVLGVGMLPVTAYHFNLLSLLFPIANLVVVPLLSLVLAAGFACLLTGFIWLKAALVFGLLLEIVSWTIFATVKLCSMAPGSSMRVRSPPLWVLGLEAAAIALAWWPARWRRKVAAFAGVALLAATTAFVRSHQSSDLLRATFLDVGDADSCLVELPGGEIMVVDTGFATPSLDCGEQLVAPFLWRKGITQIDTLVLTHPDADHTGGAPFLIENFRVGRLVLADYEGVPSGLLPILHAVEKKRVPVKTVSAGDVLADENRVRIEVLNPPRNFDREDFSNNEASIVLRISYGETSFLLTGDAEKKALRLMTGSGKRLMSRVLKAPHHGLASSFQKGFVELVKPEVVVVSGSAYRANSTMQTRVARYAPLCKMTFNTHDHGAITIESDGHNLKTVVARRRRTSPF